MLLHSLLCTLIRLLFSGQSSLHLPPVVALYAPDRLPQTVYTTVLMIWMRCLMLVEYDACFRYRIFRIMNEPMMPRISAHNRHIKSICKNDGKNFRSRAERSFASNIGLSPTLTITVFRLRYHHHRLLFCRKLSRCNNQLSILALNRYRCIFSEAKFTELHPHPLQLDLQNVLVVVSALYKNRQFSHILFCHVFVLLFQSTNLP